MLKQQVNLQRYLPKQAKRYFTPKVIMGCYSVFLLIMFLHYGYLLWHKHCQVKQITIATNQLNNERSNFSALTAQYPTVNSKDVEDSIEHLNQQISVRTKLFATLMRDTGFSNYMQAFGHAIISDVWLTEFAISKNDYSIHLLGQARHAVKIQQFLDRLSQEQVFAGVAFGLEELSKATSTNRNESKILTFSATNKVMMPHE